ncbi:MAG: LysM domain-containing protein [Myxococcota bacterium]
MTASRFSSATGFCFWWALTFAFASLATAASGTGEPLNRGLHRIKKGDTYEQLAERYYGSSFFGLHLKKINGAVDLSKDGSLIIPTRRRITAARDQSLRDFAATHMNDPERADYLKLLNNRSDERVKQGEKLFVCLSLIHFVEAKETLSAIARKYYRDASPRRVELIRLYNKISADRPLLAEQRLRIPLDTQTFSAIRVARRAAAPWPPKAKPKPDSDSKAGTTVAAKTPPESVRRSKRQSSPPKKRSRRYKDAKALAQAESALSDGDFTRALRVAGEAIKGGAAVPVQIELLRIAAIALVAKDRQREAQRAFGALLNLNPNYKLDPYTTSPKVLAVFMSVQTELKKNK